jgi:small conductance mechanosensitive channel
MHRKPEIAIALRAVQSHDLWLPVTGNRPPQFTFRNSEPRKLTNPMNKTFLPLAVILFILHSIPSAAIASEASSEPGATIIEQLNAALQQINRLRPEYRTLNERHAQIPKDDHLARTITNTRIERTWSSLLNQVNQAADLLQKLSEEGGTNAEDFAGQRDTVIAMLQRVPEVTFASIDRLSADLEMPDETQPAADQAAGYARTSIAVDRIAQLFQQIINNIARQESFGLDTSAVREEFVSRLTEGAASIAAFLDVSQLDVKALSAQLAALPGETEIASRLAVARQRVNLSASALRNLTAMMKTQDLNTSIYDTQLIAITGEITTDILDVGVLADLLSESWDAVIGWFKSNGASLVFSLLIFVLIVFATFKIAGAAQRLVISALARSHARLSELLKRMIVSTTRGIIIAIGLLVALSQIGISLGPLLAGLGIAGFVIGFALQDTLSNFASGLMILLYRPFDVSDVIEAGGVFGTVSHMSLVNTTILTFDNQTMVLPNNKIWGDVIKNLTSQRQRRVDMMFGIGYADDIEKTERVLLDIVTSHSAVLKDPEPMVHLHELGDSSVNFIVRPWVKTDDYWPVYWDITRAVKLRFNEEGISIPFPQRDVHLYAETPSAPAQPAQPAEVRDTTADHKSTDNDTEPSAAS